MQVEGPVVCMWRGTPGRRSTPQGEETGPRVPLCDVRGVWSEGRALSLLPRAGGI